MRDTQSHVRSHTALKTLHRLRCNPFYSSNIRDPDSLAQELKLFLPIKIRSHGVNIADEYMVA